MKTLITPAEAVALAFGAGEYVAPEAIAEADIAAAERRYIVPVVGRKLHARLAEGDYAEFTAEYLAAPVALWTRVLVQPRLDVHSGQCGTVAPKPDGAEPATDAQCLRLMQSLRTKARTLVRLAAEHLAQNAERFPEYDPEENILKTCTIHGNYIEIR